MNYVNRKTEKDEQVSLVDNDDKDNIKRNKLSKKRKMLEEKLEENNKAMKLIKSKKNVIF